MMVYDLNRMMNGIISLKCLDAWPKFSCHFKEHVAIVEDLSTKAQRHKVRKAVLAISNKKTTNYHISKRAIRGLLFVVKAFFTSS
jgi:hypothetical protein